MTGVREDVRYVVRSLLRAPTLTMVIVLTLALGIGLNTAIFSVVRGVLLKPLAFNDPARLVKVSGRLTRPDNRPVLLSGGMFSRTPAAVPATMSSAHRLTARTGSPTTALPALVSSRRSAIASSTAGRFALISGVATS
jgi:hypothetical protein